MSAYLIAFLLAVGGTLATILGLRRRADRLAVERDQARGDRDVATATTAAVVADAERKVEARADERTVEAAAADAVAAGDPHPERAAARARAATTVRRKIAATRKRGSK